jgi:hypothetical protein
LRLLCLVWLGWVGSAGLARLGLASRDMPRLIRSGSLLIELSSSNYPHPCFPSLCRTYSGPVSYISSELVSRRCLPAPTGHGLRDDIAERIAGAGAKVMHITNVEYIKFQVQQTIGPVDARIDYQTLR